MDTTAHTLEQLFAQLGLADDTESIERFIAQHSPLPGEILLCDAPFWSQSQGTFLRNAWKSDSDWVPMVDTLDSMLRKPPQ